MRYYVDDIELLFGGDSTVRKIFKECAKQVFEECPINWSRDVCIERLKEAMLWAEDATKE